LGSALDRDEAEDWPFGGTPYRRVESSVSCVLTRFRFRRAWSWLRLYRAFRRVRRDAVAHASGLLHSALLFENLHTAYLLSIWQDDRSIVEFDTRVAAHIDAAHSDFGDVFRPDLRHAEICSVQWRLCGVGDNLGWEGLDLRALMAQQALTRTARATTRRAGRATSAPPARTPIPGSS
jgi:hypothetical protein